MKSITHFFLLASFLRVNLIARERCVREFFLARLIRRKRKKENGIIRNNPGRSDNFRGYRIVFGTVRNKEEREREEEKVYYLYI